MHVDVVYKQKKRIHFFNCYHPPLEINIQSYSAWKTLAQKYTIIRLKKYFTLTFKLAVRMTKESGKYNYQQKQNNNYDGNYDQFSLVDEDTGKRSLDFSICRARRRCFLQWKFIIRVIRRHSCFASIAFTTTKTSSTVGLLTTNAFGRFDNAVLNLTLWPFIEQDKKS